MKQKTFTVKKDYILKAQERHLALKDTPIDSYL